MATLGLLPFAALAAEQDDQFEVLEPVVVVATGAPTEAFRYPGMVSAVGEERARRRQSGSLDDLLNDVPGVTFTGGPRRSGEVPSIRGQSGADLVLTVDGARQNFLSGHDGRLFVDPALLIEAQVLRGPASARYGSGGLGGVIALRTPRAADFLATDEQHGARLQSGYHSVSDERYAAALGYGRYATGSDWLIGAVKRDSADIELGNGDQLDSDDDIVSALLKGSQWLGEAHWLEFSAMRFANDAVEPNNGQGIGDDNRVRKDIAADTVQLSHRYMPVASSAINWQTTLYHTRTDVEEIRLDGNGAGPSGQRLLRDVETIGGRSENRSRFEALDLSLSYGVDAWRDQQRGRVDNSTRDGVPDAEAEFQAAFLQAEWRQDAPGRLPGELVLMPGVRFDHYRASSEIAATNDDQELSSRLALQYQPITALSLFASYSEAFRAPHINELFADGVHFVIPGFGTNRFVANPQLLPQRTETFEFGAAFSWQGMIATGDRFRLKGARYITDGKDFIDTEVLQPAPPSCFPPSCDGTTRAVNIPRARLEGFEVEATYRYARLEARLGLSRVDGENRDSGAPLGVLTPLTGSVELISHWTPAELELGWRLRAADDFDDVRDNEDRRAGYGVHDVFLALTPYRREQQSLRLDMRLNNVFDKAYARVFTGAVEAGRDARITLTWQF